MKKFFWVFILLIIAASSCNPKQRDENMKEKLVEEAYRRGAFDANRVWLNILTEQSIKDLAAASRSFNNYIEHQGVYANDSVFREVTILLNQVTISKLKASRAPINRLLQ